MTAATTAFDALGGGYGRRKLRGDPDRPTDKVRSYSYDVDDRRAQPWRKIGDGSKQQWVAFREALKKTVDDLCLEQGKAGYRGAYRMTADRAIVVKQLVDMVDRTTGQLDPSYQTLMEKSGRGRSTVDRALEAGEYHGIFVHVRRSIAVDGADGRRGPQRKQTSCAFYFDCAVRMTPDVYARFWAHFLRELAAFGRWFKNKARAILRTFNSLAVPSPREAKVIKLIDKARAQASPAPARVPIAPRPGLPANVPQATLRPAYGGKDPGLAAVLARMAAHFESEAREAPNEGPK